ncbi:MAG: fumarylacetoacetate hydrolase family protein [Burkholderiales bacterium]
MRIVRYNIVGEPVACARTGVLLPGEVVGDLRAGYAACLLAQDGDAEAAALAALRVPPDVRAILHQGAPARQALERAAAWLADTLARKSDATGPEGEPLFVPLARARLHNPLKPGRLLVVVGNHAGGGAPVVQEWYWHAVMGPVRDLAIPAALDASGLDYGTGLAVVMGQMIHGADERAAATAIAGYMVANIVRGASADTSDDLTGDSEFRRCLIGPALVDAMEVADCAALRLTTRVNGKEVQAGTTAKLPWPVPRLVARLSRYGLEAGDVIVTGLLSDARPAGSRGVPRLRMGDVLESDIEGLGLMRNKVVLEA